MQAETESKTERQVKVSVVYEYAKMVQSLLNAMGRYQRESSPARLREVRDWERRLKNRTQAILIVTNETPSFFHLANGEQAHG